MNPILNRPAFFLKLGLVLLVLALVVIKAHQVLKMQQDNGSKASAKQLSKAPAVSFAEFNRAVLEKIIKSNQVLKIVYHEAVKLFGYNSQFEKQVKLFTEYLEFERSKVEPLIAQARARQETLMEPQINASINARDKHWAYTGRKKDLLQQLDTEYRAQAVNVLITEGTRGYWRFKRDYWIYRFYHAPILKMATVSSKGTLYHIDAEQKNASVFQKALVLPQRRPQTYETAYRQTYEVIAKEYQKYNSKALVMKEITSLTLTDYEEAPLNKPTIRSLSGIVYFTLKILCFLAGCFFILAGLLGYISSSLLEDFFPETYRYFSEWGIELEPNRTRQMVNMWFLPVQQKTADANQLNDLAKKNQQILDLIFGACDPKTTDPTSPEALARTKRLEAVLTALMNKNRDPGLKAISDKYYNNRPPELDVYLKTHKDLADQSKDRQDVFDMFFELPFFIDYLCHHYVISAYVRQTTTRDDYKPLSEGPDPRDIKGPANLNVALANGPVGGVLCPAIDPLLPQQPNSFNWALDLTRMPGQPGYMHSIMQQETFPEIHMDLLTPNSNYLPKIIRINLIKLTTLAWTLVTVLLILTFGRFVLVLKPVTVITAGEVRKIYDELLLKLEADGAIPKILSPKEKIDFQIRVKDELIQNLKLQIRYSEFFFNYPLKIFAGLGLYYLSEGYFNELVLNENTRHLVESNNPPTLAPIRAIGLETNIDEHVKSSNGILYSILEHVNPAKTNLAAYDSDKGNNLLAVTNPLRDLQQTYLINHVDYQAIITYFTGAWLFAVSFYNVCRPILIGLSQFFYSIIVIYKTTLASIGGPVDERFIIDKMSDSQLIKYLAIKESNRENIDKLQLQVLFEVSQLPGAGVLGGAAPAANRQLFRDIRQNVYYAWNSSYYDTLASVMNSSSNEEVRLIYGDYLARPQIRRKYTNGMVLTTALTVVYMSFYLALAFAEFTHRPVIFDQRTLCDIWCYILGDLGPSNGPLVLGTTDVSESIRMLGSGGEYIKDGLGSFYLQYFLAFFYNWTPAFIRPSSQQWMDIVTAVDLWLMLVFLVLIHNAVFVYSAISDSTMKQVTYYFNNFGLGLVLYSLLNLFDSSMYLTANAKDTSMSSFFTSLILEIGMIKQVLIILVILILGFNLLQTLNLYHQAIADAASKSLLKKATRVFFNCYEKPLYLFTMILAIAFIIKLMVEQFETLDAIDLLRNSPTWLEFCNKNPGCDFGDPAVMNRYVQFVQSKSLILSMAERTSIEYLFSEQTPIERWLRTQYLGYEILSNLNEPRPAYIEQLKDYVTSKYEGLVNRSNGYWENQVPG